MRTVQKLTDPLELLSMVTRCCKLYIQSNPDRFCCYDPTVIVMPVICVDILLRLHFHVYMREGRVGNVTGGGVCLYSVLVLIRTIQIFNLTSHVIFFLLR